MLFFRKKAKAEKPRKTSRKKSRKTAKAKTKKTAKKPLKPVKAREALIGSVSHYFPHVKAGAIIIKSGAIAVGDMLHIKGHTTDFKQKVASLEIDRVPVKKASKGAEIGVLVKARVRINDKVYKIKA